MKRVLAGLLLIGMTLSACAALAEQTTPTAEPPGANQPAAAVDVVQAAEVTESPPEPEPTPTLGVWTPIPRNVGTPSLRTLADERGMLVGTSVRSDTLFNDQAYMDLLARQFNLLVVEWELNFLPVNPEPDSYNFTRADPVFDFAESNGMKVHANTLLWYREIPDWFVNGDYTRDQAIEVMRNHITTLVSRYKGRVYAWDVVNEAFTDDGEYRSSVWYDRIGPDYIELAFQFAHEADPDALLFYNDYGAEEMNAKSDAIYAMAEDFVSRGVPIDGIGFQAHIGLDDRLELDQVQENIDRLGALGLQVYFSEVDVGITKGIGTTSQRLEVQADIYRDLFQLCVDADPCNMFVVWGLADQHSWRRDADPNESALLFNDNYQPKPAYEALLQVLEQ